MRRVVITGVGPVSSLGLGKHAYGQGLLTGKDGIRPVYRQDFPAGFRAGLVDFDPAMHGFSVKEQRRLDVASLYAIVGARLAFEDAGLTNSSAISSTQVRLGIGSGGMQSLEHDMKRFFATGKASPTAVFKYMPDAIAANVSMSLGIGEEAVTVNSACSSSMTALMDAYDKIRLGRADVVLSGGIEACVTPAVAMSFLNSGALSSSGISRPFDAHRDGFVLGEGAGCLILEEFIHAQIRRARPYAEIVGFCATSDAYDMTNPSPDASGLVRAITRALGDAGIEPDHISMISAHGTATRVNDALETLAFKKALGEQAYAIPVSGMKSMLGHAIGAAGALEVIGSCLSIDDGFIPPTINYTVRDEQCDLDYVPAVARRGPVDVVLKTALAFGGHNYAMILKKI